MGGGDIIAKGKRSIHEISLRTYACFLSIYKDLYTYVRTYVCKNCSHTKFKLVLLGIQFRGPLLHQTLSPWHQNLLVSLSILQE